MMRPRLRWYWAAPIIFVVWFVSATIWIWLAAFGPLEPVADWLLPGWQDGRSWEEPIHCSVIVLWFLTPPFGAGLVAYEFLWPRRRPDGEHLRCLKCGYILKGLSEPRCPECGERI